MITHSYGFWTSETTRGNSESNELHPVSEQIIQITRAIRSDYMCMETDHNPLISCPQVIVAFPRARELWGLHLSLSSRLTFTTFYQQCTCTPTFTHRSPGIRCKFKLRFCAFCLASLSFPVFFFLSYFLPVDFFFMSPPASFYHPPHYSTSLWPLATCSLKAFLTQLVCNLLDEGNSCFRDGDWRQATQQYSEGISVARYAQAEALVIPHELLESLYVNRAAAYYQMVRENWKEGIYH